MESASITSVDLKLCFPSIPKHTPDTSRKDQNSPMAKTATFQGRRPDLTATFVGRSRKEAAKAHSILYATISQSHT
jgi:hypothetical protein